MTKKNVLVIEGSDLVRKYLASKLGSFGFTVRDARTGFEGLAKLRSELPDLVIMEYLLPRGSGLELLEEKSRSKDMADIPVIMFTAKVDKDKLLSAAKYKVAKFFSKPLRIDTLMKSISEILGVEIPLDTTPCNIDVHLNEGILFIELAQGLNREKVELMGYKIVEMLHLYGVATPKILVIMTGMDRSAENETKLNVFFRAILEASRSSVKTVKVLTTSAYVKNFLSTSNDFRGIELVSDLKRTMDELLGIKVSDFIREGYQIVRDDMFSFKGELSESIQLSFEGDKGFSIAVIDDDMVTRELVVAAFSKTGWEVVPYGNGREFVDDMARRKFDLVFLDLLMPVKDGFSVLADMKAAQVRVPVIILSALSQKETVVKALGFGVKSYMTKPLTPVALQKKAAEILKLSF
jgi:DNA-binding response OmpR family regulator